MRRSRQDLTPLTRELLEAALAAGQSQVDVARATGRRPTCVCHACQKFGIKLPNKKWGKTAPDARDFQMKALYQNGRTLEQIGQTYGITRERVRQLLAKHFGFNADSGGQHVLTERAAMRRREARDAYSLARWGCAHADYLAIRDFAKGASRQCQRPTSAFSRQKTNAHGRGIEWSLTLAQWWAIWQSSGRWNERGRGQGYVMCRKGDQGPYALGNVFIALARENNSDAGGKKSGLPMGVRKLKNCANFYARRMIGGKLLRLGSFPTAELAHAAYLAAAPNHGVAA